MLYEFDILVNESENNQHKKNSGHKQYFCEAFCEALVSFFEKKLPTIDGIFTVKEDHISDKMSNI